MFHRSDCCAGPCAPEPCTRFKRDWSVVCRPSRVLLGGAKLRKTYFPHNPCSIIKDLTIFGIIKQVIMRFLDGLDTSSWFFLCINLETVSVYFQQRLQTQICFFCKQNDSTGSDLSGLPWNWCRCFTLFLKIDRNANHNKQNKNRQVEHTVVRVPFIFFSLSKQTQHIYTKHNWNATCQQESDEETAIHARLSLDNRRRTRKVPTPPPPPLSMFAHK